MSAYADIRDQILEIRKKENCPEGPGGRLSTGNAFTVPQKETVQRETKIVNTISCSSRLPIGWLPVSAHRGDYD